MGSEQAARIRALIQSVLDGRKSTQRVDDSMLRTPPKSASEPETGITVELDRTDGENVYRDEPILRTASQMARHTPKKIQEMRKIARNFDIYSQSTAMIFYAQGKLMEDFEDDFPEQVAYFHYFPTYQSMSDQQLRCYFTWRTRVRRGEIAKAPGSYMYVYLYELLNRIGVTSAQEGYDTLQAFLEQYRDIEPGIGFYGKRWLRDYAVYYGLDAARQQTRDDESVLTLLHYDTHTPEEVCTALSKLSNYHMENSRFYKRYPEDTAQVTYRVFAALWDYFKAHRKGGIMERLIGRRYSSSYEMFQSAVFYQQQKHPDVDYEINELFSLHCRNGSWTESRFYADRTKSKAAGALLKEIDYQMRQAYGMKSTLKPGETTKLFRSVVEKELAAWLAEKRKAEKAAEKAAATIQIDVSKLQGIRQAALKTQNKLVVEEELPDEPPDVPVEEPAALPAERPEVPLSDPAYRLLQCLLYERPYADWVQAEGRMLSVLVDEINEQLFDRFDDTVILSDGDRPELIEDYIDELKGVIRE